jgi:hypothetical protein
MFTETNPVTLSTPITLSAMLTLRRLHLDHFRDVIALRANATYLPVITYILSQTVLAIVLFPPVRAETPWSACEAIVFVFFMNAVVSRHVKK